jgi:hypothetical protein
MSRQFKPLYLIVFCALLCASPSYAHHGKGIFDLNSIITLQGTVSRYVWRNPHVYVYIEAPNESGQNAEWQLEGDPTPIMSRSGWTETALKTGDQVSVRMYHDKNPRKAHGLIVSLTTPDGLVLEPRSGGRTSQVGATSIAGIWDALLDYETRRFNYGELTEKGAAAQAAFIGADDPVSDCIPYPLPMIVAAPYLYKIEILEDRVLMESEVFSVVRTFYMDGREHPENGEHTNQGHSIAWWEDEVLVVDTVLYEDNRLGNQFGIPGGMQKHSVERYELSENGTQLKVDYIIEDPEYLAEPLTGGVVWDYASTREFMPFECNIENAQLYEVE